MLEFVLDLPPAVEPLHLGGLTAGSERVRHLAKMLLRRRPRVSWGRLRRMQPVSDDWGLERGTPVDHVYIEQFLERHAEDVRGRVLEIHDTRYTRAYGGARVTSSDVLDINSQNREATIVADLAGEESLPAQRFECAIVTQTLQFVGRPDVAVANLWRSQAPGGVVLITVPSTSLVDPDWRDTDLWRFTPRGLETLLRRFGDWDELEVTGYGNLLTSLAFLIGAADVDLRRAKLSFENENFPLVACGRARKPA